MTATYGEDGLSYGAINWSYDGTELNTGAISPIEILRPTGYPTLLTTRGSTVARTKSGHPLAPCIGIQTATQVVTGRATSRTSRGAAVALTKTGHD